MSINSLSISKFPRAVLHIDGDAFFASCEQSNKPHLQGKPVITGKERGIAASLSYEAKARGVKRGMSLREIKRICPEAVLLPSDYETYSLLSKRFYEIVRRFTPEVEEYGVDECFADITGLRRPLKMSYEKIAGEIKKVLDKELGFTFSVGLSPNKSIAKIGSKWKKPSGLTVIPARSIHVFLDKMAVEDIWGVGSNTGAFLNKCGVKTALQFAFKREEWVKKYFTKPHQQIWWELNGKFVLELELKEKQSYASVQKVKTFTPPSSDKEFVFSQLSKNIENACIKLRRYRQSAKEAVFFLKSRQFQTGAVKVEFSRATSFSHEIIKKAEEVFSQLFDRSSQYRTAGVVLFNLKKCQSFQPSLFEDPLTIEKSIRLYQGIDHLNRKFGKYTVYWGTSFLARSFSQHEGERGAAPSRRKNLLPGETARKRLAIPMFFVEEIN
ncbi:MAG: DNA polymerase IV [Candidatus Moranbacteria bacterium]|nr:DNA polymerase IV [Candidatus Moranbacteria bacterium]